MTRNRWGRLFDVSLDPVRRRARPDVERLEDRTTPATLSYDAISSTLCLTASAGEINYVSVIVHDGTYRVSDARGAITLDDSAAGLGFVGSVHFRVYSGGDDALINAVVIDVGNLSDDLYLTRLQDPVTVLAGAGHDKVFVDLRPPVGTPLSSYVEGGPGNDTLRAGNPGADLQVKNSFHGGEGNDFLAGSPLREVLTGGPGNDTLRGGGGRDVLKEGLPPGVTTMELTATRLWVGSEQDVLAGIETARLTGGDTDDRLDASAFPGSVVLTGGAGADVLIGGPLGDRLYGEGGADQLFGNDGHDTLSGGPGADLFNGGTGTDLLLEEELTAGVLTVSALIAPDGIDTLASVEVAVLFASDDGVWLDAGLFPGRVALVGGTGDDTLLGGAGDDVLVGSAGADRLVGRGGNDWLLGNGQWVLDAGVDTLTGGPGDDELDGSNTIARVVEKANANFTLTATRLTGVGTDTLTSIDEVVLTGGAGANVFDVSGWTLPATLDGGGGSDLIRATNDLSMTLTDTALGRGDMPAVALVSVERARLAGGTGNNHLDASAFTRGPVTLLGGEGADTLEGGSWADRLDGGPGLDELWGHGGLDTLLNGEDNHR